MNYLSQLVRFIVTGTKRSELATLPDMLHLQRDLATLNPSNQNDAARQLLEALSSAVLLDKAGFALFKADDQNTTQTPYLPQGKAVFPSDEAILTLERILRAYPDRLISEWLSVVEAKGYMLPPEYLPDLLDRAVRDTALQHILGQVKDTKLRWLAAQNPNWSSIFPSLEQADWFTSDFNTRLALLKDTREKRPLVALSWLEKTWAEESKEHKMAFLAVFQQRLSAFDEPLLQKALQSKSRELRILAANLLAQIPESAFFIALTHLVHRLTPYVTSTDFLTFLQQHLPDVSDPSCTSLANLIHVKETDTLRTGILLQYLNYAPPSWLSEHLSLSPDMILEHLQNDPDKHFTLSGIIHAATLHRDKEWIRAVLIFLSRNPMHPLWKSARVEQAITSLPDPEWNAVLSELCRQYPLLEHPDQALFKVLIQGDRNWSKNILRALLGNWYERAQSRFSYNSSVWLPLLRSAALHCTPSDALEMSGWLNHQPTLPHLALRDLDTFWDLVKLRQKIAEG